MTILIGLISGLPFNKHQSVQYLAVSLQSSDAVMLNLQARVSGKTNTLPFHLFIAVVYEVLDHGTNALRRGGYAHLPSNDLNPLHIYSGDIWIFLIHS